TNRRSGRRSNHRKIIIGSFIACATETVVDHNATMIRAACATPAPATAQAVPGADPKSPSGGHMRPNGDRRPEANPAKKRSEKGAIGRFIVWITPCIEEHGTKLARSRSRQDWAR